MAAGQVEQPTAPTLAPVLAPGHSGSSLPLSSMTHFSSLLVSWFPNSKPSASCPHPCREPVSSPAPEDPLLFPCPAPLQTLFLWGASPSP